VPTARDMRLALCAAVGMVAMLPAIVVMTMPTNEEALAEGGVVTVQDTSPPSSTPDTGHDDDNSGGDGDGGPPSTHQVTPDCPDPLPADEPPPAPLGTLMLFGDVVKRRDREFVCHGTTGIGSNDVSTHWRYFWTPVVTVGEITEGVVAEVEAQLGEPEALFDPSLDPWLIVNMETTVSVPEEQWDTVISASNTVGPVTVSVTARPSELRFLPGDGSDAVSCEGPLCVYTYRSVSDDNAELAFPATVELGWSVEITRTFGGDDVRAVSTSRDFLVPVAEVQTVEVVG
jgi:hypothetical protein